MNLHWPDPDSLLPLSDHQRSELRKAFAGPLSILTGGPGTGKSHSFGSIVRVLADKYGPHVIGCASPFSKAAQVMSEYLESKSIPIRATTVHRLLGVRKAGYDGKGWGFHHGPANPLPYKYLFLDEWGCCDTDLCASMFSAIAPGTHVLMLGDINQLPPVGSGAPLRDFIASGLPTGRLAECWRNSGIGERCCQEIAAGRAFIHADRACEETGDNLIHCESNRSAVTIQYLRQFMESALASGGKVDPIWDCQVMTPTNEKSELGRIALSKMLQDMLNPNGEQIEGTIFRVGDKVICTKPTWFEVYCEGSNGRERTDDLIANGEIGRVRGMEGKCMLVSFPSPKRTIKVPIGKPRKSDGKDGEAVTGDGAVSDISLAYAITFHRAQGSGFDFAFNIIDEAAGFGGCRELIYTGISRFKRLCFTIGKESTINKWCRRQVLPRRKTFLKELLGERMKGMGTA